MYWLFPLFNELILCLKSACCKSRVRSANYSERHNLNQCIPIVYSPRYNIHAFGLEKLHPFDASKYRRIYEDLIESKTIDMNRMRVHAPEVPDREFLQEVMSPMYLLALNYSVMVVKAIELPICFLPCWILRMRLLEPMACASLGSVEAACIARHKGWAINLGGGFHHATRSSGSGFCIYPDITFVTHYMEKWHGIKKFLIVDLDAH